MIKQRFIPRSARIAWKLIARLIIFIALLTLVGTCLQLYIDYRKDISAVRNQLSYIEASHKQSLSNDIWLFNDQGLQAQLKGILSLPMIDSVRLVRQDAPVLTLGDAKANHPITHTFQLTTIHRKTIMQLGTLSITASTDWIYTRIKERALLILGTQFIQISFISAFVFFLFHTLVGRHLAVMAHHAGQLTISTLDNPLDLQRPQTGQSPKDELDLLVDALNSMQIQISQYLKDRRQIEDTLHEQAALLEDEIAQRPQAQEELNVINSNLEERITAAITELRQKDELLMQQNRLAAMGELLNNIAHQWRQPLNNIAAYIQAMQYLHRSGELTAEEMDNDISAVMNILKQMSQTINDFRSFFRKDREQHEFILQEVVERCISLLSPGLKDNSIQITVQGDENVRVVGYPNEYAQCLINILYNARDVLLERAVADPRIELIISREGKHAVVCVRDNGGGIPAETMPHIFEPYFTTKGPAAGTGIGLYMARTLIERNMGGRLSARNTAEGAEFRIEL